MIIHERPVRFEDIDAAGILFFARFLGYCHDAMERVFDGLPGGYVELITRRRIGFPAVHVEADFRAPLRFGDVARLATSVAKLGASSCTFRYQVTRAKDGLDVATIEHVTVSTDLVAMTKVAHSADVRAVLERHLVA